MDGMDWEQERDTVRCTYRGRLRRDHAGCLQEMAWGQQDGAVRAGWPIFRCTWMVHVVLAVSSFCIPAL